MHWRGSSYHAGVTQMPFPLDCGCIIFRFRHYLGVLASYMFTNHNIGSDWYQSGCRACRVPGSQRCGECCGGAASAWDRRLWGRVKIWHKQRAGTGLVTQAFVELWLSNRSAVIPALNRYMQVCLPWQKWFLRNDLRKGFESYFYCKNRNKILQNI